MPTSRPQTASRHAEPFVRQFSIFLPNRVGRLAELLGVLAEADVAVAGISVVDSSDWAVIRMVFSEPGKARVVLTAGGIAFTECEVLAAVLTDDQAMSRLCKALVAAELNVQFVYPLMVRRDDCPVIALHVDDALLARKVLITHGFTLLDHEDE